METWAVRHVVRLNWVVVIIASGAEERAAVDAERGDGVVEDLENGISLVAGGKGGAWWVEVARELRPVSAADGAGDAAVADVGRDAGEMEGMGALGCEYGLARAAASLVAVV